MVSKVMGMDQVIDGIVSRLGDLERAYLVGDYAEGKDTGIIDLILVGSIHDRQLADLSKKTERYIKRKIRSQGRVSGSGKEIQQDADAPHLGETRALSLTPVCQAKRTAKDP